jgi:hypothetical protein
LRTDPEGFVTLPALIPKAQYAIEFSLGGAWQPGFKFQAIAGQTLRLPEIVLRR